MLGAIGLQARESGARLPCFAYLLIAFNAQANGKGAAAGLAGATGPESPLDACPAWCGVGGRAQMDPLGDVAHTVCAEGWRCCRGSFDVYAVVGVGPTHACLWFAHIASGTSDSYAIDKYYRG